MTFDKTILLNLHRRSDRLAMFLGQVNRMADHGAWPFGYVERFPGIDGQLVPTPSWCVSRAKAMLGPGSWGCTLSYATIFGQAISEGLDNILVFEDDAVFVPGFGEKVQAYLEHVPDDWDSIYIGGYPRETRAHPPIEINQYVVRPYRVTATHAFAVRAPLMRAYLELMFEMPPEICDARMSQVHTEGGENPVHGGRWNIYLPNTVEGRPLAGGLVGQRGGFDSDIASGLSDDSMFNLPKTTQLRPAGSRITDAVQRGRLINDRRPAHLREAQP
jgi:hypothetical protein